MPCFLHDRFRTSEESGLPRELSSSDSAIGSSSLNGLESSSDELSETPQLPQNNSIKRSHVKAEIPVAVLSGPSMCKSDAAAELTAVKDGGVRVPKRAEALKNTGKVSSPLPESARRSKVKQENSGSNLVFTYKKDAEEIGIVKQASEDSFSGSDVEPVDG